jgi:soluble lytic murein transglycosylase
MRLAHVARLLSSLILVGCSNPDTALSQNGVDRDPEADTLSLADPAAREAQRALLADRPWRARRLLDPILTDSARRTPEVLLLAAQAAAALDEWPRVEALLGDGSWRDSLAGGDAHALLTQAALESGADSLAAVRAAGAVRLARTPRVRARRLVLLARAHDRLDLRDSARSEYHGAAEDLPELADWLELRAAGVSDAPAERAAHYARVDHPVARERVRWTEALARERTGDLLGAAAMYDSLDAPASALRLRRMLAGGDSAERARIRSELVHLVERRSGTSDARVAVELLDASGRRTPAEELTIARSARRSGPLARALDGYERAFAAGLGTSQDRFDHAMALLLLGRNRQAANAFRRVTAPGPLAAAAAYQRGRALVRTGSIAQARTVLRGLLRAHATDTSAGWAMLLLSDLATDENRDAAARSTYLELAHRFPEMQIASLARFRAGVIAIAGGRHRQAAAEMDTIVAKWPRSQEVLAAGYWSGRAWAESGDTARAHGRWRAVIETSPLSYYSAASARRLGERPWAPPPSNEPIAANPSVDSAMARVALLESLGMPTEAQYEYDALDRQAERDTALVLPTARAYLAHGLAWRANRLASRMLGRLAPSDARLYQLAYPLLDPELLASEAKRTSLDPALVAALIRQESGFNPRATSAAGARGLMQVMPAVGRQIARTRRIPDWSDQLLYQPEVSIELGTSHLAASLAEYDELARALAAYNAGGSRVARWSRKAGVVDPELFIERIPFEETRDYVRIVMRNRDLYRALYSW